MSRTQSELSAEQRIFAAHIVDLQKISEKSRSPVFSGFLADWEQSLCAELLRGTPYIMWGGFDGAERKMLCIGECLTEDFPVSALTFRFRACDSLSHRDFLGALMNLGLKRSTVGDILVGEGYGIVFVEKRLEAHILEQITKIGRVGVSGSSGIEAPLPEAKYELFGAIVASLRLDGVAAAMCGQSREKTSKLIRSGLVQLDGIVCTDGSRQLCEGAVVSVRGSGKFRLHHIGGVTKKGNIHIDIKKFI